MNEPLYNCTPMPVHMRNPYPLETLLFDLRDDPGQEHPIEGQTVEEMIVRHMVGRMKENDAPAEQFERLGLPVV